MCHQWLPYVIHGYFCSFWSIFYHVSFLFFSSNRRRSILIIESVGKNDTGQYECRARNKLAKQPVTRTMFLRVDDQPDQSEIVIFLIFANISFWHWCIHLEQKFWGWEKVWEEKFVKLFYLTSNRKGKSINIEFNKNNTAQHPETSGTRLSLK